MKVVAALAAAFAVLVLAGGAGAGTQKTWMVRAALSAAQEVPAQVVKAPAAHGMFTATLSGTTLRWKLSFAKLTGPATAAHVHMARRGRSGNVIVAICGPCRSGASGTARVSSTVIAALKKGTAYVNVHTAKNPNGEIRGQLALR